MTNKEIKKMEEEIISKNFNGVYPDDVFLTSLYVDAIKIVTNNSETIIDIRDGDTKKIFECADYIYFNLLQKYLSLNK